MPPKFTSRQLAYDPPPVPSFLQKLHGQVNQNRATINDKHEGEATSEFDSLLGVGSGSAPRARASERGTQGKDDEQEEEEDEWDGAQIVVLKEGKHLSKEEAASTRTRSGDMPDEVRSADVITGPQAAPSKASAFSKRRAQVEEEDQTNSMDEAKQLIASSKKDKEGGNDRKEASIDAARQKRKEEKEKVREEKNKKARVEKAKRGKGLSFELDD